ncbi:MAG: ATP-dependent helicase [Actinomycetota bacterium]|nr:ATP-dependent helicase [Actinomycetota bacterium]
MGSLTASADLAPDRVVLDEVQRSVVEHRGASLLVLGGPGTGKTSVLEERFLRLSAEDVAPHRILFLCTNRHYSMAAKDRLARRLPMEAMVEVPVYTWHALAYHLVSRYHRVLGYGEAPVLLTGPEQWGIVRQLMAGEEAVDWPVWRERLNDRGFIDEVADFCLRVEQRMIGDDDLDALMGHRHDWAEVVRFYRRYRDYLKVESRLDYAGLIATSVRLLKEHPQVRDAMHLRFPHVLVDDGQELSKAHRALLTLFDTSRLVVAADADSGIEHFRGAEPDWLHGFGSEFGEHNRVILAHSYRLGAPLLGDVLNLIDHNDQDAAHRPSSPASHPTSVETRLYASAAEEVEMIARDLRYAHVSDGIAYKDMAVLISQPLVLLSPLERAMDRWEVPFEPLTGDRPLASEPIISAFIDLARVALRLEGWEQRLASVLTSSLVGLSFTERRDLQREAWRTGSTLADIVEHSELATEFRLLRDTIVAHAELADSCFWEVHNVSRTQQNLVDSALTSPEHPANSQVDALVAFGHALGRFVERRHGKGSLADYLSEAARADFGGDPWLPPGRATGEGVSLITFHSAKGREWHTVFVAGCLDSWIPKGRRARGLFDPFALEISEAVDREIEAIADDRRTFYVASTRARSRVVFSVSPGPSGRGRPSRFLSELTGSVPEPAGSIELAALTPSQMRARLRRQIVSSQDPAERIAAIVALAEVPGTDPRDWYGRWDWTEGALPLAVAGSFKTSYSRLNVFDNCGLEYVLESVLGLDPVSSHSMKFGTWIHALFQAVHEGKINDIRTFRAEYARLFDPTVFPNRAIAEQFRKDGEKMLKTFWEHEFTQDNVLTEKWFEVPYEGAIIRGRIDRIDITRAGLRLTDYKTAKWAPSVPEVKRSLQLAIYYLAARNDPELKELGPPIEARLVFPGSFYPDGNHKTPKQIPEQADEVLEGLPDLLRRVMAEDFKPSADADCRYCKMKPLCPLWPQGREVIA